MSLFYSHGIMTSASLRLQMAQVRQILVHGNKAKCPNLAIIWMSTLAKEEVMRVDIYRAFQTSALHLLLIRIRIIKHPIAALQQVNIASNLAQK